MDLFSFQGLATPLQILLVDLLLGADNALLIGLASRALPARQRGRAVVLGISGAVVLRLAMTFVATSLLAWPLVKLAGALVLTIIALNLAVDGPDEADAFDGGEGDGSRLWTAAAVIVVADAVMSLDNVVALAAIAQGNFLWLLIGVGLSLPMLGYGGLVVAVALHRAPGLAAFGAALLGWIAGGMALTDPVIFSWADSNAPGLVALAPVLGAAYVFSYGRFVGKRGREPVTPRFEPAKPVPALEPPLRIKMVAPASKILEAAPIPPKLEPHGDVSPEPVDMHEPEPAPANNDDRIAIIGLLLLAVAAGAFLMIVSYYDSFD